MNCESADKFFTEPIVVISNDQFVEIIAEKLEDDADMFSEDYKVFDFDDVGLLVIV